MTTEAGRAPARSRAALLVAAGSLIAVLAVFVGCGSAPETEPPAPPAGPSGPVAGPYALPPGAAPGPADGEPVPGANVPVWDPAVPEAPPPRPIVAAPALDPSSPTGLRVPAIGVREDGLMQLALDPAGALQVPPDAGTAGWYTLAPTPGAAGPSIIAAHVDYGGVQGVFSRLADLAVGDEVEVPRTDGSTAVFTTYRVERYPKNGFPSDRVYGDTPDAELRLITCGGVFDRGSGHYRDNVVVYARLTGIR